MKAGKSENLVIGVTGHRMLGPSAAILNAIRREIKEIREKVARQDGRPPTLVVLSALAEGADRLVAREVLKVPGSSEMYWCQPKNF